jgi:hypothetical protein
MKLLQGKVAVITGAARGIGEAVALKFAEQGAQIAFTYISDSSAEKAAALVLKIEALGTKAMAFQSNAADFNACIDALATGYPVTIGFNVYSSFTSSAVARTGMMPYPNTRTERLLGGHAVLLVGYNKSKNMFIVRNSWGKYWGQGGYFYMPFQVIQNTAMSNDFWIIKSIQGV